MPVCSPTHGYRVLRHEHRHDKTPTKLKPRSRIRFSAWQYRSRGHCRDFTPHCVPSRHRENMLFEWGTTSAYHRSIHQNLSSATCSVSQMSVVVGYVILRFVVLRSMLDLTDVSISRDETSIVGGLDGLCWLHGSTNIVHCWWTKNTFDS